MSLTAATNGHARVIYDASGVPLTLASTTTPPKIKTATRQSVPKGGSVGSARLFQVQGEEYQTNLTWPTAGTTYKKMARSSATIRGILNLTKMPIISAGGRIVGGMDGRTEHPAREYAKRFFGFDGAGSRMRFSWSRYTNRIIERMLTYGHAVIEPQFASDGSEVWVRHLYEILPTSISEFRIDVTGELMEVVQRERRDPIDALDVIVYTLDQEGDDVRGQSALRSLYRHWYYADLFYKMQGMALDRWGSGIPIGVLNEGASPEEQEALKTAVQNTRAGELSYTVIPYGAKIYLLSIEGNLPDFVEAVEHHHQEMKKAWAVQFLDLGTSQSGSRALHSSASDDSRLIFQSIADAFADDTHRELLCPYLDRQFGAGNWPEDLRYVAGNVAKIDVERVANAVATLSASGFMPPIPEDAEYFRGEFDMPMPSDEDAWVEDDPMDDREAADAAPNDEPDDETDADQNEARVRARALAMQPVGLELLLDLNGIDRKLENIASDVMEELEPVIVEYRETVAEHAAEIDPRDFRFNGPSMPLEFEVRLRAAMRKAAGFGTNEVIRELDEQSTPNKVAAKSGAGIDVEPRLIVGPDGKFNPYWSIDSLFAYLDDVAASIAQSETIRFRDRAASVALRARSQDPAITPTALARLISDDLGELSSKVVRSQIADAVNNAFNEGRHVGASEAIDDGMDIEAALYSSIRDEGRCENCAALHGSRHAPFDPKYHTPNPSCKGGMRCRCTTIYQLRRG